MVDRRLSLLSKTSKLGHQGTASHLPCRPFVPRVDFVTKCTRLHCCIVVSCLCLQVCSSQEVDHLLAEPGPVASSLPSKSKKINSKTHAAQMVYTVFGDDAVDVGPQKSTKSSPKKKLKTAVTQTNGYSDETPVASTSTAILPPAKLQLSPQHSEDAGSVGILFKKRKAAVNGLENGKIKSRKRSLTEHSFTEANGSDLSITAEDKQAAASTSQSKSVGGPSTPLVTSKRVATFYDDEDEAVSDDEDTGSPGKARRHDLQPGESRKQARKRQQTDRKDKADHLLSARQKLPVFSVKDAILKEIEEQDTVVVLGETGSGKTTRKYTRRVQHEFARSY